MPDDRLGKTIGRLNAPVTRRIAALLGRKKHPWEVYGLISEFMFVKGKRLRPALCLLSCEAVGGNFKAALPAAATIEMFHNFTLIHDDIEDSSEMRRGKPCMYVKYGLPLALNAGDGLFMMVWQEALGIRGPRGLRAQQRLLAAFTKVLEGQSIELGWYRKGTWKIGRKEYYGMVGGKTGALLAVSCEVGALLGGADRKTCNALYEFGMGIGIGFQIIDDVLNLIGDEKKYRKEIGGDIREGKRTLLTMHALSRLKGSRRAKLERILKKNAKGAKDIGEAILLIRQSGAVEAAVEEVELVIRRAMGKLRALPESRAKKDLSRVAEYVVRRNR